MPYRRKPFEPGTLWPTIVDRARSALACGAMQPIETEGHIIEDRGVRFQVRLVSSLIRKHAPNGGPSPGARANPFLPYEPDLYVADVSDTHVCILNKYNVIDYHVLIITRAFEPQERPLTLADFEALRRCMAEYDALAIYNSAPVAGASQPHKHLQLLPLPLGEGPEPFPMAPLLAQAPPTTAPIPHPRLPFRNTFAVLDPGAGSACLHTKYAAMLRQLGGDPAADGTPPYNLLMTRDMMLLIPRAAERYESLSVNALGFAGSFFIPDRARLEVIERAGPMTVLQKVALPPR